MDDYFEHMKEIYKTPYEAPQVGDLDLLLERTILIVSIPGDSGVSPLSVGSALDDATESWTEDW